MIRAIGLERSVYFLHGLWDEVDLQHRRQRRQQWRQKREDRAVRPLPPITCVLSSIVSLDLRYEKLLSTWCTCKDGAQAVAAVSHIGNSAADLWVSFEVFTAIFDMHL